MHVASLPAPAGAPRASPSNVISNGAGRLFLPLSLLRKRRPAQREISLLLDSVAAISCRQSASLFEFFSRHSSLATRHSLQADPSKNSLVGKGERSFELF